MARKRQSAMQSGNSLQLATRPTFRSWLGGLDLVVCCALVVLAGLAYAALPDGSVVRVALALTVLFFAPGYLLIEATTRASGKRQPVLRALLASGVSPPLVGLLALATAVFPNGFRPASIIVVVTLASFTLAGVAILRRSRATRVALAQASAEPGSFGQTQPALAADTP